MPSLAGDSPCTPKYLNYLFFQLENMREAQAFLQSMRGLGDNIARPQANVQKKVLTDSKLLSIFSSVENWKLNRPQKPKEEIYTDFRAGIRFSTHNSSKSNISPG